MPGNLPVEKPLGQGRNEGHFDDESHQCLKGSEYRERIVERDVVSRKEAATVETGHVQTHAILFFDLFCFPGSFSGMLHIHLQASSFETSLQLQDSYFPIQHQRDEERYGFHGQIEGPQDLLFQAVPYSVGHVPHKLLLS
jgi:hypothetical protein